MEDSSSNDSIPSVSYPPGSTKDPNKHLEDSASNPIPSVSIPSGSAKDPSFLKDFYSRSRLHFISTLAQEMKEFLRDLKRNSDGSFPGKDRLWALAGGRRSEVRIGTAEKVIYE